MRARLMSETEAAYLTCVHGPNDNNKFLVVNQCVGTKCMAWVGSKEVGQCLWVSALNALSASSIMELTTTEKESDNG